MITAPAPAVRSPSPADSRARRELVEQEFAQLLNAASTRGFHGTASIVVSLQDGHIQNWRVLTERLRR